MADKTRPRSQKKKDKVQLDSHPAFRKAKSLFSLHKPDLATEEAWKLYIANRLKASKLHDLVTGPDDYDEEENDLDKDEKKVFELNRDFIANIDQAMMKLEKEMRLQELQLSTNYSVIHCDMLYCEAVVEDEALRQVAGPEYLNIITRIYSPTRPLYIDVHLGYEWMLHEESGYKYRIGFKVYPSPAKNDYPSGISTKLNSGEPKAAYISNGWQPFAYGHTLPDGKSTKLNVLKLDSADVQNFCDILWGPQVPLLDDADKEAKHKRRKLLVNSIRFILAGTGIACDIASTDDEEDRFTYWELGRMHQWISREIRNTCGFQLERDLGEVSQDKKLPWPYIDSLEHDYEFEYSPWDDYEFDHRSFPY